MPIRSSQKRGHDVADEDQRHKKENAFDSLVTALNNQPPNSGCREGYRHKAGDAQKFSRRGDAHKFRNRHSPVGDQQRQHHEGRPTHAKPFANQIGKAFAGNRSHSRAHFLHDSQTDRYGYECPEDGIAVISPGRSVSGNTTGIISRVSGDNAWANDRKINEQARPPGHGSSHTLSASAQKPTTGARRVCLRCGHSEGPLTLALTHPLTQVVLTSSQKLRQSLPP